MIIYQSFPPARTGVTSFKKTTERIVDSTKTSLENTVSRLRVPTLGTRTILARWFGNPVNDRLISDVRRLAYVMKYSFNVWRVVIEYGGYSNTDNAECFPPVFDKESSWALTRAAGNALLEGRTIINVGKTIHLNRGEILIKVYNNILNMDIAGAYAAGPDQDATETLMHEMSHALVGTTDEETNANISAYGRVNALQLVADNKDKARMNAENWAMALEELGH